LAALPATDDRGDTVRIVVSDRERSDLGAGVVALRPPSLVVGVGTTTDASPADAQEALTGALATAGLSPRSVGTLATIDRRRGHLAIDAVAGDRHLAVRFFSAAQLEAVPVPTPSDVVASAVGTHSVAEAAAQEAAGPGAELERVRLALDLAAQGKVVALVCSGDAGVYAMASPALELAGPDASGADPYGDVEITVIPGVTAGLAAAALLGAPIGHDFLTVSLSDLLTPWALIEARVRAAAETDLVLVVYNPRSATRTWQIEKVRALLLEHRSATTPVGVVANADRADQAALVTTLGELDCDSINMTTCLVIGSSQTTVISGRMVTPRGYSP
jgi:precorrin-3B C17-methyltransferase